MASFASTSGVEMPTDIKVSGLPRTHHVFEGQGGVVAFEFHNPVTGDVYVDYDYRGYDHKEHYSVASLYTREEDYGGLGLFAGIMIGVVGTMIAGLGVHLLCELGLI